MTNDPYIGLTHLWDIPGVSNATVDRKRLRAFLEATGGEVLARGHLWDVKSKHLGAGMYKVQLRKRAYDAK